MNIFFIFFFLVYFFLGFSFVIITTGQICKFNITISTQILLLYYPLWCPGLQRLQLFDYFTHEHQKWCFYSWIRHSWKYGFCCSFGEIKLTLKGQMSSIYSAFCQRRDCQCFFLWRSLDIHVDTIEPPWFKHWWLVYHGCFELILETLGKKSPGCRFRIIQSDFLFLNWKWYIVCCIW